jgi:DNA-binding MarR family transcriptional regulator
LTYQLSTGNILPVATSARSRKRRRSDLDKAVIIEIARAADGLKRRFAALLEPYGLTLQQFNVLRILRGARPDALPTMEIAERMLEQTPGITGLLDRLEAKGLIERQRQAEDRRCVKCTISDAGLRLLAELEEPIAEADAAMVRGLDAAGSERLVELLRALRAAWSA